MAKPKKHVHDIDKIHVDKQTKITIHGKVKTYEEYMEQFTGYGIRRSAKTLFVWLARRQGAGIFQEGEDGQYEKNNK